MKLLPTEKKAGGPFVWGEASPLFFGDARFFPHGNPLGPFWGPLGDGNRLLLALRLAPAAVRSFWEQLPRLGSVGSHEDCQLCSFVFVVFVFFFGGEGGESIS